VQNFVDIENMRITITCISNNTPADASIEAFKGLKAKAKD